MKTAISIDDKIFSDAEATAKELGVSRSELYTRAVREYVDRYRPSNVTESYNKYYKTNKNSEAELQEAAAETLSKAEWE